MSVQTSIPSEHFLLPDSIDLDERIRASIVKVIAICQERFPNLEFNPNINSMLYAGSDERFRYVFSVTFYMFMRENLFSKRFRYNINQAYNDNFASDLSAKLSFELNKMTLPDWIPNTQSDLLQLDEFLLSESTPLLTARSGLIDLADTTASNEDIAPASRLRLSPSKI